MPAAHSLGSAHIRHRSSAHDDILRKEKQAQMEVRRELAEKVRNDFVFRCPPPSTAAVDPIAPAAVPVPPELAERADLDQLTWREREFDTDMGSEDGEGDQLEREQQNDPYKFDSPDAVGAELEDRRKRKRRRRRRQLEEEMAWNEGLRCWALRRDAWTGGRASQLGQETVEVVPVAPPLVDPNNPIRQKVAESYDQIYKMVVLEGRSPSIPLNLADMTKSLVKGWKDNDEWPPKLAAPEPSFSRRKEGSRLTAAGRLNKGVVAVKKAFGLNGSTSGSGGMRNGESSNA